MNDELTPGSTPPDGAATHSAAAMHDGATAGAVSAAADARPGPDTEPPPLPGPPTAGAMIREGRQAQGIDVASLAAMLKIPLRRLDALENGRHDELQGPTFERALAQAACRVLKMDPKPVLALLPQHEHNTLERVTEGINTPFRDGQGGRGFELPSLMHPWVLVVVLFVAAAGAVHFVPDGWLTHASRPLVEGLAASVPTEAAASAAPVVAEAASDPATAPADTPAASAAAAAGTTPSAGPSEPAAEAVSATAAQGVDEVLAHEAAEPAIPLQVIADADSWVEVVDAKGRTLLSRTVVAGESVGLDGPLPMHVKIGNASGTHLKLRGDNVDLTPSTRDNVARLVVK
jgi:cytoskeleton protein RodZ